MAQSGGAMDKGPYGPYTYSRHWFILDLSRFLFWLAGSNKKVKDRKATTVRQILRTIFAKNGVPKTIVMDNVPEFSDESFVLWLRKIGCMPYKTPSYHSQSNGIVKGWSKL